jgi:hypothetical protein
MTQETNKKDALCILKFEQQLPADWWKFVAQSPSSPNLALSICVDY